MKTRHPDTHDPSPYAEGPSSPLDAAVSARDYKILDMVSEAIAHRETALAFQPIVTLRAPQAVAFHEGLIRVFDATGRVIPGKDFIAAIEPTDLGRQIDCIGLEHGLETLRRVPNLRLSINMSARSIGYRHWMHTLNAGLAQDPTIAERLILEITERSAITIPELVTDFMEELQMRGVAFALDDFGAGYTSFRHFRDFYFDIVKIDGEFIRGIHANADNQVLTAALASIAGHFDMFTVAEKVEDARDAAWLAENGIDCAQGHFFGAPTLQPPWLASDRTSDRARDRA
ncbi:MAG: diguanylate phosphodiesterase [Rhodobacteraceae bacterium]|nr:diguanylate phosphodiesterase [Paracoccaceae bacterium]MAY47861.1 diguanylate phosphodiesterase [Paracoccaceae bacterium]QEW18782.1 Cyclic di-GMP phosphodiesterase YfgF [Marinibacterium anthonyi]